MRLSRSSGRCLAGRSQDCCCVSSLFPEARSPVKTTECAGLHDRVTIVLTGDSPRALFLLAVIRRGSMLSKEVLFVKMFRNGSRPGIRGYGLESDGRNLFQNHGDVRCFRRRFPPAEWCMAGYKNRRHLKWIELLESPHDGVPGVCFIVRLSFSGRQRSCYRDWTAKVVGMGCPETRNFFLRLRPRSCGRGMRVRDASNTGERLIKNQVRRKVRGRSQRTFFFFFKQKTAYEIFRLHRFVRNTARLDRDQPLRS